MPISQQPTIHTTKSSSVTVYVMFLAGASMFPLALNRCCFLYFSHFYERVFKKQAILLFIIGYDVSVCIFYFISRQLPWDWMEAGGEFLLMFLDFVVSIFLYIKIRKMISLASITSAEVKNVIVDDLYRVSILCTLQALFYIAFLFLMLMANIFYNMLFIRTYLITFVYQLVFYELVLIVDSSLLLFMLKSYRNELKRFWQIACEKVLVFFGKSNVHTISGVSYQNRNVTFNQSRNTVNRIVITKF